MHRLAKLFQLLSFALAVALLAPAAEAQSPVERGHRWEQPITAPTTYGNNWLSTKLCVQYTAPSGKVYTGLGFWESEGTTNDNFKIRAAFNETGSWSWQLIDGSAGCVSKTGFTPLSGTVTVNSDTSGLPIFALGPVRTRSTPGAGDNRFLHYSGSGVLAPFVWIGDTSWGGAHTSFLSTWTNTYLTDRVNEGMTVTQISVPLGGSTQPTDVSSRTPFIVTGCPAGTPLPAACARPDKDFWSYWDNHVRDINDKGMLAVVIGLFKRTYGTTWPTVADSSAYGRWIAARLAWNQTVLSPGFDELPTRSQSFADSCTGSVDNQACRARAVGTAIKEAILLEAAINASPRQGAPLTALVTHHIGGGCSDAGTPCLADLWLQRLQGETWLDFQLFQSGQGKNCPYGTTQADELRCLTERARQRARTLYDQTPTKPVVNGEAVYDQDSSPNANYSDFRARQAAFYSLLSGAAGFTHGVAGTWDWGGSVTGKSVSWSTTTAVSPFQMGAIGQLFAPFRWNRLLPDCQLWTNACTDIKDADQATLAADKVRVFARDSAGHFAIAYLPDNTAIKLDLSDLSVFSTATPWSLEWFDPRRGCYCTATATGTGPYTFNRPATGDWALVLTDTSFFTPPASRPLCGATRANCS